MRSFIVRLWHPLDPTDPARGLRGTVVHVSTGRSSVFADGAALLEFLQAELEPFEEAATTDPHDSEEAP
jgi:hypothetical protein